MDLDVDVLNDALVLPHITLYSSCVALPSAKMRQDFIFIFFAYVVF